MFARILCQSSGDQLSESTLRLQPSSVSSRYLRWEINAAPYCVRARALSSLAWISFAPIDFMHTSSFWLSHRKRAQSASWGGSHCLLYQRVPTNNTAYCSPIVQKNGDSFFIGLHFKLPLYGLGRYCREVRRISRSAKFWNFRCSPVR